ncbi:hypothetical protein [Methanobrevibacter sp. UBA46]|uniref:hypothetical protein n=1 Tax=Methanobrevibacter sp. UBA46 TaxID=1915488 RepID=UPI0039B8BC20
MKKTIYIIGSILLIFFTISSISATETNNNINPITQDTTNQENNINTITQDTTNQENIDIQTQEDIQKETNTESLKTNTPLLSSNQENILSETPSETGIYYVENRTGLEGDGSFENPYHSIKTAVNTINQDKTFTGNYTINIASGTYTENSIEITKNITFNGNNTNGEIIVNGDQKRIFNSYSNTISINFNNLTLTNGSSSNGVGGMISISNGYINFTNCKIKSNTAN